MPNPFALLADEGDDEPQQVQTPPKAAAAPKPATNAVPKANNASKPAGQQPRGKPDYPARNNVRSKVPAGTDGDNLAPDGVPTKHVTERDGRGKGGSRSSRGGRGAPRGGNRQFDRHSQTGRVDSDKQEHQAWGGDDGKRELADEENGVEDAKNDQSGLATPAEPAGDAPKDSAVAPIAEEEEEDKTRTYDEYLKEKAGGSLAEKLGLASLSVRKANEGADDAQWKDAVPLTKEEEEDTYFAGASKENKPRTRTEKKAKTFLETQVHFPRPGGDRPERGGRGGARGGRGGDRGGRGGARGSPRSSGRGSARSSPASSQRPVDTSDASAFPSLS